MYACHMYACVTRPNMIYLYRQCFKLLSVPIYPPSDCFSPICILIFFFIKFLPGIACRRGHKLDRMTDRPVKHPLTSTSSQIHSSQTRHHHTKKTTNFLCIISSMETIQLKTKNKKQNLHYPNELTHLILS